MVRELPIDWADPEAHQHKRALSGLEKATVLSTAGQAMIFPGSPETEVEELVAVGFDSHHIHCVERVEDLADALYEHYYDRAPVHYETGRDFLDNARSRFGYVHLDFMGHLDMEEIATLEALANKLDPVARVRVSVLGPHRQSEAQATYLEDWYRWLVGDVLAHVGGVFADDAAQLAADLATRRNDPTVVITALALFRFVFGADVASWVDACTRTGMVRLPPVAGTHRLTNVRRYCYHEPLTPNLLMFTTWFDAVPLGPVGEPDWAMREFLQILHQVRLPVPYAMNPQLMI